MAGGLQKIGPYRVNIFGNQNFSHEKSAFLSKTC